MSGTAGSLGTPFYILCKVELQKRTLKPSLDSLVTYTYPLLANFPSDRPAARTVASKLAHQILQWLRLRPRFAALIIPTLYRRLGQIITMFKRLVASLIISTMAH
jgi:hypothetical protein